MKRGPKLKKPTPGQLAKGKAIYEGGGTIGEVAEAIGASRFVTRSWLIKEGVGIRKPGSHNKRRLPVEELDKTVGLYASGLTLQEVGDELGITRQRAEQRIQEAGYKHCRDVAGHVENRVTRVLERDWPEDERARLKELYLSGTTYEDMASLLGVKVGSLKGVLKLFGLSGNSEHYRKRVENMRHLKVASSRNSHAELIALYESGVLVTEIAEMIGCTRANVYAALRRAGVRCGGRGSGISERLKREARECVELRGHGRTYKEIMAECGMTYSQVQYRLMVARGLEDGQEGVEEKS